MLFGRFSAVRIERRIDRQKIGGALCAGQKILQITDVLVQLRFVRLCVEYFEESSVSANIGIVEIALTQQIIQTRLRADEEGAAGELIRQPGFHLIHPFSTAHAVQCRCGELLQTAVFHIGKGALGEQAD